tara:strand:+ start:26 stop:328 length:303 start_codon:yes stop_codon:yes gene_type:complete
VLKVSEVYEKQFKTTNERPDGSEFITYATKFDTRECLVNENYIVAVHPHIFRSEITEEKISDCFPENTKFCTLVLDGNSFRKSELLVVGSFERFCKELGN